MEGEQETPSGFRHPAGRSASRSGSLPQICQAATNVVAEQQFWGLRWDMRDLYFGVWGECWKTWRASRNIRGIYCQIQLWILIVLEKCFLHFCRMATAAASSSELAKSPRLPTDL